MMLTPAHHQARGSGTVGLRTVHALVCAPWPDRQMVRDLLVGSYHHPVVRSSRGTGYTDAEFEIGQRYF